MSFDAASFAPQHFLWAFDSGIATITLNRPERKNPLTFASYAELRDTFRALCDAPFTSRLCGRQRLSTMLPIVSG